MNQATTRRRAQLQKAYAYLEANELALAEGLTDHVLAETPNEPDGLHVKAIILAALGSHSEAETFFRRSIAYDPSQPEAFLNYGMLLRLLGRDPEAVSMFRRAIELKPEYTQAYVELGQTLDSLQDWKGAIAEFQKALQVEPNWAQALSGLGMAFISDGRPSEAVPPLRKVLTILDPADDRSIGMVKHNLGLALARTEQPEEALRQMAQARIHREDLPLAERDRATALQRLGRTEEAIALYRSAIARNPLDLGAHTELNKLLYREGDDTAFLKSYDEAFAKNRQESQLPFAKGAALLGLHRYEPALEAFAQALHLAPDDPVVLNCYAVTAGALGRTEEAVAMHERSAALSPDGINGISNFATTLLRVGDPQRALQLLAGNLQRAPLDQNTLALMSVAFRALGDPRDAWLMGYDTLVRVFDLEPPAGYADIASFNRELDVYLNAVHTDKREYPDQTLRGGTQSPGDLFSGRHGGGPVAALKTRIDEAVQQYIAALGDDGRHPLLGRKRQDFAYAGSWSSRLHDSGRHTNHIHMRGWISSAYYVAVPDAVDDAEAKQGWIKFGEPNFDARLSEAAKRTVQPKPGRLVLFPSYMWHGTNPFRSTSARTTIAFDVIPA